jgi:hypothetical protein
VDVGDGIAHDVGHVTVRDPIDDFSPEPTGGDQVQLSQGPQMLGHQGLRHSRCLRKQADTARRPFQRQEQSQPGRVPEQLEELGRLQQPIRIDSVHIVPMRAIPAFVVVHGSMEPYLCEYCNMLMEGWDVSPVTSGIGNFWADH